MDLSGDGMDWLNASSSGNGSMNDTTPTFQLFFPCRQRPISSNTTSPFVWGILPELEPARPYVATIQALFIVVGIIWNLFVLISYCIKPRLLKEPANIYLFNLVVSDLILTIFITFSSFLVEVIGEFIFGSSDLVRCNYCLFLGVVMHTLISLSLHTLMALSVDRFVVLFKPMSYKSIFNWKRALVIQAILWVIAIGMSISPIFGFGEYEFNLGLAACHARWSGKSYRGINNLNYVIFYGVEALIPIIILAFTNIWVIKIVSSFLKKRISRRRTYREDNNNSNSHQEERQYQRQQRQLIRVFGALFVAHIVCWTPVLTASFVAAGIGATKIPVEIYVFSWLAYLIIPVVHPIIESFFIKDLRYRIEKTQTTVRSSFRRARGSLYSQVSSTSLAKSLGRTLSNSEFPKLKRNNTHTEISTPTEHRALAKILSTTSTTSRQTVAHTLSNGSSKVSELSRVGNHGYRNRASTASTSSGDQTRTECESIIEQNGAAKKRRKKFSTVSFTIEEEKEVDPTQNSAPPSVFMEPILADDTVDKEFREAIANSELQDDVLEA